MPPVAPLAAALIPVTTITGFLGSGKTTLLNGLLRRPELSASLIIINEFGEIGLDHLLVATPEENVVLLANGCLCCELRGELAATLNAVEARRARGELPQFHRVLVETSGLAEPAPLLADLLQEPELCRRFRPHRVVAVVDGVQGSAQLARHDVAVRQVCAADDLVVTKTDLATAREVAELRSRLERLNPGARTSEAVAGEGDQALLRSLREHDAESYGLESWLRSDAFGSRSLCAHEASHDRNRSIRSFGVVLDQPVTRAGLEIWLNLLGTFRGPDLLRIKGLLNVEGRPVVLHAVQHLFHPLVELAGWPAADRRSRLAFITDGIEHEAIARTLPALSFAARERVTMAPLDVEAYRDFAVLAGRFR